MSQKQRREGPGDVNAGPMADIAFLLLIFFLVTTTMDTDEGILRQLPPPTEDVDPPEVTERNIFKVKVNANDQLLVDDKIMKISELKDETKKFYTNPTNSKEFPKRVRITREKCNQKISNLKSNVEKASGQEKQTFKRKLKIWKERKKAVELMGPFDTLPNDALISLRNDRGTSYDMYIQVQNELTAALNELRNELIRTHSAFEGFDSYSDFKPNQKVEHQKYVKAVRQKYPQRISEAEPTAAGE